MHVIYFDGSSIKPINLYDLGAGIYARTITTFFYTQSSCEKYYEKEFETQSCKYMQSILQGMSKNDAKPGIFSMTVLKTVHLPMSLNLQI